MPVLQNYEQPGRAVLPGILAPSPGGMVDRFAFFHPTCRARRHRKKEGKAFATFIDEPGGRQYRI